MIPKKYAMTTDNAPEGTKVCTCSVCKTQFAVPENEFTEDMTICEECAQPVVDPTKVQQNADTQKAIDAALGK